MAKRGCDPELEMRWRQVLGRQAASKLSVREFCRLESLSEASYYAWRKTIAERDGQAKPKPRSPSKPNSSSNPTRTSRRKRTTSEAPAFLPVVLDADGLQSDAPGIVIELRGQRRLRLPATIEPARLAMLVHAIEAEPRR